MHACNNKNIGYSDGPEFGFWLNPFEALWLLAIFFKGSVFSSVKHWRLHHNTCKTPDIFWSFNHSYHTKGQLRCTCVQCPYFSKYIFDQQIFSGKFLYEVWSNSLHPKHSFSPECANSQNATATWCSDLWN